ncbi:MAG: hypothetical protein EAY72_02430 [Bacteroidetes bacterium]|nr:MAG: hypothetical protein EAY72_02430 [Bacteroidota bacterium]
MKSLVSLLLMVSFFFSLAQTKNRFQIQANYRLNGNFFVRSYDELTSPNGATQFYNKNFVGTIGGIEVKYRIGKNTFLGLGFDRSANSRSINYTSNVVPFYIQDFTITHWNSFHNIFVNKDFSKKKVIISTGVGLYYLRSQQQEIDASLQGIALEQRNFKNSRLEELGASVDLEYKYKIDTHIHLGLRTRFYYTLSTAMPEAIVLAPTLSYTF